MKTRRALMFTPGDDRRKIEKGAASGADALILDLEDGVALNAKPTARQTVAAALREVAFGRSERWVRLNAFTSEWWEDDLRATLPARPDGFIVPKIEHGRQVQAVSAFIEHEERRHGLEAGSLPLLVMIETALGVANLNDIAPSDARLVGLIFGAEDLAGSLGATRTPQGWEVFYGRSAVVLHARAYGLQAYDAIFTGFTEEDLPMIEADTEQALFMGYDGKTAIHPRQVEVIQRLFTPGPDDIARAARIVDAYHAHQAGGTGAFALDGKMVDMPVVRQAERVLARARAAGAA